MYIKHIKRIATASLLLASCATTSLQAGWADKMTMSGYGNIGYHSKTEGASGVGRDYSSFVSDDLDLMFNFQPVDKFRIAVDISFDGGADTEYDRGAISLAYFFMEYKQSDAIQFRLGKQFTYFGIYSEIQATKVAYISIGRPHVTSHIGMSAGGPSFIPNDLTGLSFLGNLNVLEGLTYNLTISNGSNPKGTGDNTSPYTTDREEGKAVTAKSVLSLNDSWDLGASVHMESYPNLIGTSLASTGTTDLLSYGAQLTGEIGDDIGLEIEVVSGSYQITPTGAPANAKVNRLGYTIMPSYSITDNTILYTRYNFADAALDDNAMYKGTISEIIVGVNYEVFSEGTSRMVLKLEYDNTSADANTRFSQLAGDISKSTNFSSINAQVAVSF